MKLRWVITLLFTIGCSLSAFAGSPQIGVLDPQCNANSGFTNIFNLSDPLVLNPTSQGGGVFTFCNLTGHTWSSVQFQAQDVFGFTDQTWVYGYPFNPSPAFVTCSPGTDPARPYDECVVQIKQEDKTAGSAGTIFMTFFNPSSPPDGVHSGYSMTVTLNTNYCVSSDNNCNNNTGNWIFDGKPVQITGTASTTPEPTSLLLLGAGLLAVCKFKR